MTGSAVRLDPPLWNFSLAVYGRDGVADECLDVQERFGVDVNVLLLCAYAGATEGAMLSDRDVADAIEAVGAWHAEAVRPLRQVRRTLKPYETGQGAFASMAQALRARVKAAELEAERIEQAMLWAWLEPRLSGLRRMDTREALAANLRVLLARYGADPAYALPRICRTALEVGAQQTSSRTPEAVRR